MIKAPYPDRRPWRQGHRDHIDTGHSYNDRRIALAGVVAGDQRSLNVSYVAFVRLWLSAITK